MGGATGSKCVRNLTEGKSYIRKFVLGATEVGLFPEGDAVIFNGFKSMNGKKTTSHTYKINVKWVGNIPKRVILKKVKEGKVAGIACAVAGIYGKTPTKNNPFVCIVRCAC